MNLRDLIGNLLGAGASGANTRPLPGAGVAGVKIPPSKPMMGAGVGGATQNSIQRVPGGAMVYGGYTQRPGFQEDMFEFPTQGGIYQPGPGGVYLDKAFIPQTSGFQEDDFYFPRARGHNPGAGGTGYLRSLLGDF